MASLRKQVIFGALWRFAEQFGSQIIACAVSVIPLDLSPPRSLALLHFSRFMWFYLTVLLTAYVIFHQDRYDFAMPITAKFV